MYDPGPSPESDVLDTINEVTRAFFRLLAVSETVVGDLRVTGAERGVMRDLFIEGESTAPEIARRKPVTRQAIQPVIDGLVERGLIRGIDNPYHKRSRLYLLTSEGIELCVEIQRRELAAIREMIDVMSPPDFAIAARALKSMNELLDIKINAARAASPAAVPPQ